MVFLMAVTTSKTIRVCQLWEYYLPVYTGAAVRHNQLAPLWRERDIEVNVLTVQRPGTSPQETINDTPVYRVSMGRSRRRPIRQIIASLNLCRALLARRKHYDLVHAFAAREFLVPALLFAKLLGKPVIQEFNILREQDKSAISKLRTSVVNFLLRFLDVYVGISTPLIQQLQKDGLSPSKCKLLPYGVFSNRFIPLNAPQRAELRRQLDLSQDAIYLVFVGSFEQRKGVDTLVEMMVSLQRVPQEIHLIIVGPHDYPEGHPGRAFAGQMKVRIRDLGLDGRVHLTGKVEYNAVLGWLQASDIFVFPSRREGLGRVILEAMAVGLPCVVSELDRITYDFIDPDVNGIVVKDYDPDDFSEQIMRLAADKPLRERMGVQARLTVLQRFDEHQSADAHRKLFEMVLARRFSRNPLVS